MKSINRIFAFYCYQIGSYVTLHWYLITSISAKIVQRKTRKCPSLPLGNQGRGSGSVTSAGFGGLLWIFFTLQIRIDCKLLF